MASALMVVVVLVCQGCGDPEPGGSAGSAESETPEQARIARYTAELAEDPDNARVLSLLADTLIDAGDYPGAAEHLSRAAAVDPDDPEVHFRLGIVLTELGDTDAAITSFEESIDLAASPDAYVLLGVVLSGAGRNSEAVTQYQSALVLDPDSVDARYNLGVELGKQGRWKEAAVEYRVVLEHDPDHIEAANNLGAALLSQGRVDDAVGYFERVLRLDPADVEARGNWATALTAQGKSGEAIGVLEGGIALAPDAASLANHLAWLRAAAPDAQWRDGEQAVRLAEMACARTGQENASYLDTLAAAYAEAGRFDDAIRTVSRALTLVDDGSPLAGQFQDRLTLYEAGTAYHESTE
jgi:tetratricopeptide (TPR) repeat protein